MTNKELADLLLPNVSSDISYYENKYPSRNLKDGAVVTRFAPSPTGFVHMGSLFAAFIEKKAASDTGGIFFLRIEDTDQKREVENGVTGIINDLKNFDIIVDEGMISENDEVGSYGPYIQSKRKDIYQCYAKHLIEKGLAYPCFCSENDIEETRQIQEKRKQRIGYYGRYAKCRRLSFDEIKEKIDNGEPYIIRFKSPGLYDNKIKIYDLVKGEIDFPENDLDLVILKSDGLPTYHFAHVIDDHLMHTTHVIRGDEWISSLPVHIQLFNALGFKPPKYAHLSPIMKEDDGKKRKLSKRKDPEAAVSFYHEKGIPVSAVKLYLMTVANTNFEQWYDCNKEKSIDDFKFDFKKISSSGALFDVDKLYNISKNYISYLKAEDVYKYTLEWAKEYDQEFAELLIKYPEYSTKIFNIERQQKKPRKDYSCYSMIKSQVWYMFDELFQEETDYDFQLIKDIDEIKKILSTYLNKYYDEHDDKDTWFNKVKLLAEELGYAKEVKEYKNSPELYKGHVGDISTVLRVALTTRSMTPDLYALMILLGKQRIIKRFNLILEGNKI